MLFNEPDVLIVSIAVIKVSILIYIIICQFDSSCLETNEKSFARKGLLCYNGNNSILTCKVKEIR